MGVAHASTDLSLPQTLPSPCSTELYFLLPSQFSGTAPLNAVDSSHSHALWVSSLTTPSSVIPLLTTPKHLRARSLPCTVDFKQQVFNGTHHILPQTYFSMFPKWMASLVPANHPPLLPPIQSTTKFFYFYLFTPKSSTNFLPTANPLYLTFKWHQEKRQRG